MEKINKMIGSVKKPFLKEEHTHFHLTVEMKGITKTHARKIILKSVIYNRNSYVYIWYLVANWACEVIVILTQKRLPQYFFV